MKESDIHEWLLSEVTTILSNTSLVSLSNPATHVDVASAFDESTYPFVGILGIANTSQSAGIGNGDVVVDDTTYSGGQLQSITYRIDKELRVELDPVTDNDPKLRDDLCTELSDHFSLLARNGNHPADMEPPDVDESTTQNREDDFVRGEGVPMDIEYSRYIVDDDPDVATDVNLDIDAEAPDETSGDTNDVDGVTIDAFDETV